MRSILVALAIIAFLCCIIACQQSEEASTTPKTDVQADIQAIKDVTDQWQIAINAGDLDTLMSFYSENAVKIPPNEPAVVGKEAIRSGYQKLFEKNVRQENHSVTDIKVSGDLAVTNTAWTLLNNPERDEGSSKIKGNWVRIFGKQTDGSWKIIYMIWSDESLASPEQPDPFIGSWKLIVAKTNADIPNAIPKSETLEITSQQNDIKTTYDGMSAEGKSYHIETTGKWNGEDTPAKGHPNVIAFAIERIDSHTAEFIIKKKDGYAEYWPAALSKDGKTMTSVGKGKLNGQEYNGSFVYEKQ